jgi:hypothetical protein
MLLSPLFARAEARQAGRLDRTRVHTDTPTHRHSPPCRLSPTPLFQRRDSLGRLVFGSPSPNPRKEVPAVPQELSTSRVRGASRTPQSCSSPAHMLHTPARFQSPGASEQSDPAPGWSQTQTRKAGALAADVTVIAFYSPRPRRAALRRNGSRGPRPGTEEAGKTRAHSLLMRVFVCVCVCVCVCVWVCACVRVQAQLSRLRLEDAPAREHGKPDPPLSGMNPSELHDTIFWRE